MILTCHVYWDWYVFPNGNDLTGLKSQVTPALGILDFVQMLIALGFIIWFFVKKTGLSENKEDLVLSCSIYL